MSDREPRRFTDEELHEFYKEFQVHQEHEEHDRHQLMHCMNENKNAVIALKESLDRSNESTKGLVEAWDATVGAVRVSAFVGRFVKWVAGIGLPLYALYELLKHAMKLN